MLLTQEKTKTEDECIIGRSKRYRFTPAPLFGQDSVETGTRNPVTIALSRRVRKRA